MEELKHVTIYTDGFCDSNPGHGGYGVLLIYGEHQKELCGGYRNSTNNRMEIMAAIKGLEALKDKCKVTLYSDSKYVVDAISQGWARKWRSNGWKRNKKEKKALNPDLWAALLNECDRHNVEFLWVKGHAGNPGNERADRLSEEGAVKDNVRINEFYEGSEKPPLLI